MSESGALGLPTPTQFADAWDAIEEGGGARSVWEGVRAFVFRDRRREREAVLALIDPLRKVPDSTEE
jgi:hypothetical protein